MPRIHRTRFAFGVALATAMVTAHGASAYTYKVIHDFCSKRLCADGQTPMSGVILDASGNIYGTTQYGGSAFNGTGTAYGLVPNTDHTKWKSITLYKFAGNSGTHPLSAPILDANGNLYGVTHDGGILGSGTAYELTHKGTRPPRKFKLLVNFPSSIGKSTGGLSYQGAASGTLYDGSSPLYVTTPIGGQFSGGTIVQLSMSGESWRFTTLYAFCAIAGCEDGKSPGSTPMLDANGHIFGTTVQGGSPDQGVVYELMNSGGTWTESVLHTFCQSEKCLDGATPTNALMSDAAGNFFGTASLGGQSANGGLVFQLAPDGTYTPVYNFCSLRGCSDGALPKSDLLVGSDGTLYGVTANGGGHNGDADHAGGGTVFALNGSTLQTLYSFCAQENCRDGEYPVGGLIMDAQGNLFGTTTAGGKYGAGVVFELTP